MGPSALINNVELKLIDKKKPSNDAEEYGQLQFEVFHLKELNQTLLKKMEELETRLKKYTNGDNHKRYYEKNKLKIKESGSLYLQKLKEEHPEKLKAYSRAAYQRKKEKKMLEEAVLNGNVVLNREALKNLELVDTCVVDTCVVDTCVVDTCVVDEKTLQN